MSLFDTELPSLRLNLFEQPVQYGRRHYLLTCCLKLSITDSEEGTKASYEFIDYRLYPASRDFSFRGQTWFVRSVVKIATTIGRPWDEKDWIVQPIAQICREAATKSLMAEMQTEKFLGD